MKKTKTTAQAGTFLWALFASLLLSLTIQAQNPTRTIKGKISSQDNKPIAGASITVKGTSRGYSSDANGNYSIQARSGEVLEVSSIGFQPKEVAITGSDVLDVRMISGDTKLNEVVVIGYGTSRRANLTGAQSSVTAKEMDRTINTTLEQAIQGRAAGAYVTQNSGQPGGGISINIRGVSTINGSTQPLYVVDGVQFQPSYIAFGDQSSTNPIAGLNPADIDNIQILQGPSATAIYGSMGTNGVILVTTKRGKSGETKFNFGYQYGLQTPPDQLPMMNLRQYAQMVKEFHAIAGGTVPIEFLDPSLLGEGTNWQKEVFTNAAMNKYQLSMSGGNEKTTYYMSGDYLNQEGIAKGSGFDRYSIRVNLDNKPKDWITIGTNLSFSQTNEVLTTSQENVISDALQLTPQVPVKNLDGSWGGGDARNGANVYGPVNPIAISNLVTNKYKRNQFLGGLNLGLKLTKDLTFRTAFNTSLGFNNGTYYKPTYQIGWAINDRAQLNEFTSNNTYWNFNQMLEYNKQLGNHNLGVMVGHEAQESKWKNVSAGRTGFLTNDIEDLNAGDALTSTTGGGSGPWAMESYLGRLTYNFDNRYILRGTFRYDGSANFGDEKKWGLFPAISAAWRISQEKFFNVEFISDLKLRVEAGTTGNSGGQAYIYSPMSAAPTPNGTGFLPGRYGNQEMQWEPTTTYNVGINAGFFKDRLTIEFDYYQRNTDQLIMESILPWYMGTNGTGSVGAPGVNLGKMNNKGWGFTINSTNINNGKFRWESSLNLSGVKTTIEKFNTGVAQLDRISWWMDNWTQRSVVGQAPWLFLGYKEEGLFQSLEEIQNSAVPVDNNGDRLPIDEQNGLWVGDVKFKDINGDGKINEQDLTFIGNPWPKLYGGFTNTFSYKGFDMSILITGTYGNDIYNYIAKVSSNANNINVSRNLLEHAMEYAKPTTQDGKAVLENPGTDVPRISYGPNENNARPTSKWVEDGSFLRLKNVTLTYNLPGSVLNRQKIIKGARISFSGQNLATLTGYKGMDPEVGSYVGRDASSANQATGVDFGRYPLTRIYSFSIGVDF